MNAPRPTFLLLSFAPRLAGAIREGARWLEEEQPKGALLDYHGITRRFEYAPSRGLLLRVVPMALDDAPALTITFAGRDGEKGPRFRGPEELEELRKVVETAVPVARWCWGAERGRVVRQASFVLNVRISLGLAAALLAYGNGCPGKGHVLCQHGGCDWYPCGRARLRVPTGWS